MKCLLSPAPGINEHILVQVTPLVLALQQIAASVMLCIMNTNSAI